MSKQTTNNVFGIARDLADGLNNNGIVTNVVDLNQGGENPAFAVRLYQRLSTTDGGVVVINSGKVVFRFNRWFWWNYFSDIIKLFKRYYRFFTTFIDNDIGDTVNTNITIKIFINN